MSNDELKCKPAKLTEKYSEGNSSESLVLEIYHIAMVLNARTVGCIGTVKCLGRVQIRKYISQPQCQFEDVPNSSNLNVSLKMFLTAPASMSV